MKQPLPLSQFSEPQAVLLLLGWLRLLTAGLLLLVCILAETIGMKAIQPLLDWPLILGCNGIIVALSIFTRLFKHKNITQKHLLLVLLLDIICWSGLVAGSGGSINPAISYLLVLLSIAALSLPGLQAAILTLVTVMLYAVIMKAQPQQMQHHGHMMGWHLWGMWILFMLNAVIMLVVIALLSRALREKDKAIAAYREETVRNEQLVSMGTMAANIAHELGTPLSTMGILLEDIELEEKPLLQQQLERCRKALQQLKNTTQKLNEAKTVGSTELLQRWVHECLLLQPQANIEWQDELRQALNISPLFEQALLAVLNNAVEAANTQVWVRLYRETEFLLVDIRHDGEKIREELLKMLGQQTVESSKQGLGLGYYLANASIERLGGRLQISNQDSGVLTRIRFPLAFMTAKHHEPAT